MMQKHPYSFFRFLRVLIPYLFLYIPILVLILFSFNSKPFPANWEHFTLDWYYRLFRNGEVWSAFFTSLLVATFATFFSLMMGILLIFFRSAGGKVGKAATLFYGNLLVPETVLALSLLGYFTFFRIRLGLTTLVVAHTGLGLGVVIPILYARYAAIDSRLLEVSQVSGANTYRTFRRVLLPLLLPTLSATGFLIFILSFDDFILAYFCSGPSCQTLSLYLLSMLKTGISPMINALSTVLFLVSGLFIVLFCVSKARHRVF
ncbi:MAG: ABC transporter permease [Simkaniaceae bacterium]|nr:ABC transporter permease [Simkaniaceae bacterium]